MKFLGCIFMDEFYVCLSIFKILIINKKKLWTFYLSLLPLYVSENYASVLYFERNSRDNLSELNRINKVGDLYIILVFLLNKNLFV